MFGIDELRNEVKRLRDDLIYHRDREVLPHNREWRQIRIDVSSQWTHMHDMSTKIDALAKALGYEQVAVNDKIEYRPRADIVRVEKPKDEFPCKEGHHKFDKWDELVINPLFGSYQTRTCKKCGLTQKRKV